MSKMSERPWSKLVAVMLLTGLLGMYGAGTALAATGERQLTVQQALDLAMTNSNNLKSASYSIDKAQSSRDAAADNVDFEPTGPQTDLTAVSNFNGLVSADLSLQQSKEQYQIKKDSVVISVYTAYNQILQDQAALDVAQQALNLADFQKRVAALNNQVGGASKLQLQQAGQALTSAQSTLTGAEKSLADDYQKFNQLVGLTTDARPVPTDQPDYTPLKIGSLDAEVSRVLESSPSLAVDQKSVDQAQIKLNIYSGGSGDSYQALKKSLDIAKLNVTTSQDSTAQSLRSLYYSITQLESTHDSLQQTLATDEMNLQMTQLKYDTGAASSIDLLTAQSAVAKDKKDLLSNICQHQADVLTFETPWAGSASGGSSAS